MVFLAGEWDNLTGADQDLTKPAVRCRIKRDAKAGKVLAAMLAPPCLGWSLAFGRRGAARSVSQPWGFARVKLPKSVFEKVQLGNSTFKAALDLIQYFFIVLVFPGYWSIQIRHTFGTQTRFKNFLPCQTYTCVVSTNASSELDGANLRRCYVDT